MRKMSVAERKMLVFMAGTPGRWTRGLAGVGLIIAGVVSGGFGFFLLIPGVLMLATGIANYCPAGLFIAGSGSSDNIMARIAQVDAVSTKGTK
jgi:hypothetical protein